VTKIVACSPGTAAGRFPVPERWRWRWSGDMDLDARLAQY
jgi:hypothetical protein